VLIERALDLLLHGTTSIIIAHRLSTVRRADQFLVVEHGRIVQRGRFDALLAAEGPFRRLARELDEVAALELQPVQDAERQSPPVIGRRDSRSASVASSEPE
jgi:ABC-type oligopeptide transport system ATPase subunit